MPDEISLSTQVLFFKEQTLTFFGLHHRNFRGTNTEALEIDAKAESLVDTTHEQFLKVFIRQPVRLALKHLYQH